MMCLVYQSNLCIATIIFYTCFYFPFLQAKQFLRSILRFINLRVHHHSTSPSSTAEDCSNETSCSVGLAMGRHGDLRRRGGGGGGEEVCSVCLAEFECEDLVSLLSECGHVFHVVCIERWLERNQFTCPLCRSVFLNVVHGCRHATCNFSFT
ncbi:hypothetical protein Nepgr_015326 [Nepenthes gracilis]|uniref:RING-type domain-containing protein n=1 Tax=Nepenthes gracilis TaxID=150966 RepID=A0AAD3XRE5_NEPGR|nr:hypothetical protein Nepgr_015326 [Nepenthes gracilis]